jgi:hypothetical protein
MRHARQNAMRASWVIGLLAALLLPASALGQKKPPAKAKAAKPAPAAAKADGEGKEPAARVEKRGGVKVYRLDEIKVEGRIQKPTAFYVLQRSSLNYELESLKQQFVPNILKSVQQDPF